MHIKNIANRVTDLSKLSVQGTEGNDDKIEFQRGYGQFLAIPSMPLDCSRNSRLNRPKVHAKQRGTTLTKHKIIQQTSVQKQQDTALFI